MTAMLRQPLAVLPQLPGRSAVLVLGAGLAAAGLVAVSGAMAAMLVAATLVLALLFAYPRPGLYAVLLVGFALDPGEIGFFRVISDPFWRLPAPVAEALPLKTNPFELLIAWLAFAAVVRPAAAGAPGLPRLAAFVPLVLVAGLGWGVFKGGNVTLAYHEARGLIFATLAFFTVMRVGPPRPDQLARLAFWGAGLLAAASIVRWVVYLRGSSLPMQYWFDHETGLFLGFGAVLGCVAALKTTGSSERALAVAFTLITFAAVGMTGRRSGILALGVGVLIVGWLVMPKRPALLVGIAVPALIAMAGYLSVYWDGHTGPLAEPARAIRSQVDPDERDRSSDEYRIIERANVQMTLQSSPLFGVGFGRPYTEYEALPELAFWPLQYYTPHQNILWLWLKTGVVGAAVLLGLWVIAFKRCILACRSAPSFDSLPVIPLALAAGLLMVLAYARVDLAFVGSRSVVFCAVLLALVFSYVRPDGRMREAPP